MASSGEETMVFTVEAQKGVPAPFLTKTYQLVDDPKTDHIVSWGEDESTFVVWRPPEFARDLLPNYFKHSNFSSFVRQLNTYGFKKIVTDKWEFGNEYFRKGAKHLLCEIHRRKTHHHHQHQQMFQPSADENQFPWADPYYSTFPSPPSDYSYRKTDHDHRRDDNEDHILTTLTEDNQRLRRKNYMLLSELNYMKKLYNDIIFFIQNHVEPAAETRRSTHCYDDGNNNKVVEILDSSSSFEDHDHGVKLFGVPLSGKKRLHTHD